MEHNCALRSLLFVNLILYTISTNVTNIGLFMNVDGDIHGGKMEGGLSVALEKINRNETLMKNVTFRVHPYLADCDKKKIIMGSIRFVTPDAVDVMIGDTCQTTAELAGLVASDYNVPLFDFSPRPLYLTDKSYGTLIRTRGSSSDIRNIYLQVAHYQNFRSACLYVPQQAMRTVQRVQQSYALDDKKTNVTLLDNFYFDMFKTQHPALKKMKISCRGNQYSFFGFGISVTRLSIRPSFCK